MGKLHKSFNYLLGLLCAAAVAFPALAADKLNLPVDRHGYLKVTGETYRHPTTAKIREAISGANPHVEKLPGGGLSQSLPADIELTATKQTSPINAKVKVGAQALKNGAFRCIKSLKCNIGVQAAAAGLDALLDSLDWVMNEGAIVAKNENAFYQTDLSGITHAEGDFTNSGGGGSFATNCGRDHPSADKRVVVACDTSGGQGRHIYSTCSKVSSTRVNHQNVAGYFNGTFGGGSCGYNFTQPPDLAAGKPIKPEHIDNIPMNNYDPHPSDFAVIARYVDPSDPDVFAEISSIPSILTPPTTKTIFDADGNPVEVQETNIWYDFDITDNNTKQPAIDITENKEVKTYDSNGMLTGRETTTSTSKAVASSSASSDATLDIPTDCEFMPTVCRFLSWFQEPDPELSNEPDLKALKHDLEPERNFTVGSSTAGCPAPIQINLAMFPSVEVSLQPLCDFVDLLRPLLLAFAFYFAGRIVLRT